MVKGEVDKCKIEPTEFAEGLDEDGEKKEGNQHNLFFFFFNAIG